MSLSLIFVALLVPQIYEFYQRLTIHLFVSYNPLSVLLHVTYLLLDLLATSFLSSIDCFCISNNETVIIIKA